MNLRPLATDEARPRRRRAGPAPCRACGGPNPAYRTSDLCGDCVGSACPECHGRDTYTFNLPDPGTSSGEICEAGFACRDCGYTDV